MTLESEVEITKRRQAELIKGLERARASWMNRVYMDSSYKSRHEKKRSAVIDQINNLLEFYKRLDSLSKNQEIAAKRIIDNMNAREDTRL